MVLLCHRAPGHRGQLHCGGLEMADAKRDHCGVLSRCDGRCDPHRGGKPDESLPGGSANSPQSHPGLHGWTDRPLPRQYIALGKSLTDQIQVCTWFGAVGFTAYTQSGSILPVYLAFTGVCFYGIRGYIKYVTIYIEMADDQEYLRKSNREVSEQEAAESLPAGLGHSLGANLRWLAGEQHKIFHFNEGVFIFMLSLALILNALTPMLWIFAISQTAYGLFRGAQRCRKLHLHEHGQILTASEK